MDKVHPKRRGLSFEERKKLFSTARTFFFHKKINLGVTCWFQVDHFQKRQSFMTSQMRDDQEDAIRQRDELRDEIDKHRARSMVRKSSIKKSITAESLKRSSNLDADDEYGLGAEKSFDEGALHCESNTNRNYFFFLKKSEFTNISRVKTFYLGV